MTLEYVLRKNGLEPGVITSYSIHYTKLYDGMHFAPTVNNKEALLKENIYENIYITGNTVIDALKYTVSSSYTFTNETLKSIDFNAKRVIVLTAHRRENLGDPLKNICSVV